MSDGPGTRTVVFLKGCPLHCPWCANPESQDRSPQIGIFPLRCVSCDACSRECPEQVAIPAREGTFTVDGTCTGCGTCIDFCHAQARTWLGKKMSVDEIMAEIKKDKVFYRNSNGGVTFSGGEPLIHPDFLYELISQCRKFGIHTAVETCGFFNWSAAEKTMKELDYVMFDIKHMNDEIHRELTGVSNERILDNVKRTGMLGIPLCIRIPVIPSLNDSDENIRATARFVKEHVHNALGIELLPYHKLGLGKYEALGMEYSLGHIETPDDEYMKKLQYIVAQQGVDVISVESDFEQKLTRTGNV